LLFCGDEVAREFELRSLELLWLDRLYFLGLLRFKVWDFVVRTEFLKIVMPLNVVIRGNELLQELDSRGCWLRLGEPGLGGAQRSHTWSIASCNCVSLSAIFHNGTCGVDVSFGKPMSREDFRGEQGEQLGNAPAV